MDKIRLKTIHLHLPFNIIIHLPIQFIKNLLHSQFTFVFIKNL